MPRIRRHNLPPALLKHLLDRIQSREISVEELGLLAEWLDTEPEVPEGKWFKRFSAMIVCWKGRTSDNVSDQKSDCHRHRTFLKLTRHRHRCRSGSDSLVGFLATCHLLQLFGVASTLHLDF